MVDQIPVNKKTNQKKDDGCSLSRQKNEKEGKKKDENQGENHIVYEILLSYAKHQSVSTNLASCDSSLLSCNFQHLKKMKIYSLTYVLSKPNPKNCYFNVRNNMGNK